MPVLVVIQASLVSKKVAKSSLVTVKVGNALPVPIIFISFSIWLKRRKSTSSYHAVRKMCRIRAECGEKAVFVAKFGDFWGEKRKTEKKRREKIASFGEFCPNLAAFFYIPPMPWGEPPDSPSPWRARCSSSILPKRKVKPTETLRLLNFELVVDCTYGLLFD